MASSSLVEKNPKSKQSIYSSIYRNWMVILWVQLPDFDNIMIPLCICLHKGVTRVSIEQPQNSSVLAIHLLKYHLRVVPTAKVAGREEA